MTYILHIITIYLTAEYVVEKKYKQESIISIHIYSSLNIDCLNYPLYFLQEIQIKYVNLIKFKIFNMFCIDLMTLFCPKTCQHVGLTF